MKTPATLLKLNQITKAYGTCVSYSEVDLEIFRGEVHALIGENGAGKSTLMRSLLGVVIPDSGSIEFDNHKLVDHNPIAASRLGIGMVHQHFMLAENLTVFQNIALFDPGDPLPSPIAKAATDQNPAQSDSSQTPLRSDSSQSLRRSDSSQTLRRSARTQTLRDFLQTLYPLRQSRIKEKYDAFAKILKFQIPWDSEISQLAVGVQQKIEILKALAQNPQLLIFDEPTAVLTPQESDDLLSLILDLKEQGKTILFVSHKLKEVKKIADRISVLKQGKMIGTFPSHDLTLNEMANLMIAGQRDVATSSSERVSATKTSEPSARRPLLTVENLDFSHHSETLKRISFQILAGEIVGFLGVEGNGQKALVEYLSTLQSHSSIAILPDDRLKNGLFLRWPAWLDFALSQLAQRWRFSWLNAKSEELWCRELMIANDIRPPNPQLLLESFSGGNQQKYVVARELLKKKSILVAPHPTRGVDIGAIHHIHQEFLRLRSQMQSVLLITSDLDEAFALCDRVYVLFKGRIQLELDHAHFDIARIGQAMGGL